MALGSHPAVEKNNRAVVNMGLQAHLTHKLKTSAAVFAQQLWQCWVTLHWRGNALSLLFFPTENPEMNAGTEKKYFVKMKKVHDSFSRWLSLQWPGREQRGSWGTDHDVQGTDPCWSPLHSHAAPAPPAPAIAALASATSEWNHTAVSAACGGCLSWIPMRYELGFPLKIPLPFMPTALSEHWYAQAYLVQLCIFSLPILVPYTHWVTQAICLLLPKSRGLWEEEKIGEDLLALSLSRCQSTSCNPLHITRNICSDQQLLFSLCENLLGPGLKSVYSNTLCWLS